MPAVRVKVQSCSRV